MRTGVFPRGRAPAWLTRLWVHSLILQTQKAVIAHLTMAVSRTALSSLQTHPRFVGLSTVNGPLLICHVCALYKACEILLKISSGLDPGLPPYLPL